MEPKGRIQKVPTLVLYWADTKTLLTFMERQEIGGSAMTLISATPEEILFRLASGRRIAVIGSTDVNAPALLATLKPKKNGT